MKYLLKPVTEWTPDELRQALRDDSSGKVQLQYGVKMAAEARLEAVTANARSVEARTEAARQKRLLLTFTDTTTKPSGSIDVRSVKHAAIDATNKKGGGPALTVAGIVAAYEWGVTNNVFPAGIPQEWRGPVLIIALTLGCGWWLIGFAIRLTEKWGEDH